MDTEFEPTNTNDPEQPAASAAEPEREADAGENWEPRLLRSIQERPLASVLAAVAVGYVMARIVTRVGRL